MIPEPIELRRALHRVPELGFSEHKTSEYLKKLMGQIGKIIPVGDTGFYVDMGPSNASKTLLLRADMDGLPVQEETGLAFASQHEGHMHACGHDAHMAALVSAAYTIRDEFPDDLRVRFLFQPAEEGRGGARFCVSEGVLNGVDTAFGLHLWNELPIGQVALTDGGIMGSVIEFKVNFVGRGGHGALPERANNPIYAASALAKSLESFAPSLEGRGALSVGALQSGAAFNVIPEDAVLTGTARAFDGSTEKEIEDVLRQTSEAIAKERGIRQTTCWERHCPITCNDPDVARMARDAAQSIDGLHTILDGYRTMAGEDFGEILEVVPGAYALLGSGKADGTSYPHHSPFFEIEEAAIPIAVALHCAVVEYFAAQSV
jgi:amidohydrolase